MRVRNALSGHSSLPALDTGQHSRPVCALMENCWEQLAAGQIINKDMPRLDNRKYEVRGYHWDLMEDLQSDRPLQRSTQCVNKSLQAAPLN